MCRTLRVSHTHYSPQREQLYRPWAPEGTCRRVDHLQCTKKKRQATPQCPNRSQIVPPPPNFVSCTPSESESTFVIATRLCFCLEGVALRDDLLLPSLVYSLSSCYRQMLAGPSNYSSTCIRSDQVPASAPLKSINPLSVVKKSHRRAAWTQWTRLGGSPSCQ